MDYACSFHMCCNRDRFTTYEPISGVGFAQCKVAGKGTIRIKMHYGVTMTFVRCKTRSKIGKKKILISMGTLDTLGYQFICSGDVLKVSRDTLAFMKGHKVSGCLYILQGSKVSGGAAVCTSSMSENDMMKVWHMSLGNVSERGITILSKRDLLCGQSTSKMDSVSIAFIESRSGPASPEVFTRQRDSRLHLLGSLATISSSI